MAFALIALTCGVCGVLAAPFVAVPPAGAWPWLLASVVLHNLYFAALLAAYGVGDLSLVYPIARGLAPLGVAAGAAMLAAEWPGAGGALGIGLASLGVLVLSLPSGPAAGPRGAALAWSGLIAGLIVAYTLVDGIGTRAARAGGADALSFVSWMFLLEAPPFLIGIALWYRRHGWPRLDTRALAAGTGAGLIAYIGYAIVLAALAQAPMAYVSALRESSVLFAALLGTFLLGEPFGRRRIAASGAVALGLGLMTLGG